MEINDFIKEIEQIGINLDEKKLKQLNRYFELLVEWNEKMNLTGITEKKDVYLKHFYDSATLHLVVDLYNEETLCDVGTGAGFPGLVLKILFPNLKITLIDSLNKRINFLQAVIDDLQLENIEAIHARSEDYALQNRECFDIVTARAVASLPVLMEYCVPLVKNGKYFIPLKAKIEEELKNSENAIKLLDLKLESKKSFKLPVELSDRTIIKFKKQKNTLKKFPRKYSEIKKKPL